MSEVTELIELPSSETALEVFTDTAKLDEIIEKIRVQVIGTVYDMSKRKDREACASDAYKVARTKTAAAKIRATVSANLKDLPKKVDAGGRYLNERLEAIQEQVRAPLTEWEQAEEDRIKRHQGAILAISELVINCPEDAASISARLAQAERIDVGPDWEEFEVEAEKAKDKAVTSLRDAFDKRQQYEAEQAELAKLRAEAEARRIQDEKDRIAREAAEAATKAAETKAQAERDAAAKREADAREAQEKAERDRLQAIERQKQAEAQAEQDRLASIEREKQAVERARLAEIQRQADEKAQQEAEAKRREDDRTHKQSILRAAKEAIMKDGFSEDQAVKVVKLIAAGKVPNVSISY